MDGKADRTRSPSRSSFEEAASLIKEAARILILGPCLAKHLFQNYLCEQHPKLFRKIVGCENHGFSEDSAIIQFSDQFLQELNRTQSR